MFNTQNRRRPWRFFFVLIPLAFIAVFGAVVMWLWNAVLPDLLHISTIRYGQAVGLLVLCRILFGGFRFGRPNRFGPPAMRQKWMAMNEEERQRFKEEWRKRCEERKA